MAGFPQLPLKTPNRFLDLPISFRRNYKHCHRAGPKPVTTWTPKTGPHFPPSCWSQVLYSRAESELGFVPSATSVLGRRSTLAGDRPLVSPPAVGLAAEAERMRACAAALRTCASYGRCGRRGRFDLALPTECFPKKEKEKESMGS